MRGAGLLRVRRFADDEASVQSIPGWDLHCLQVSAGSLAGESIDVHLPTAQLLFETYRNVSTSHCGTAPKGALVFGVCVSMAGEGRLNGVPWCDGITVFDARQELVSVVPPADLVTVVVDLRAWVEDGWCIEPADLEHGLSRGPIVLNDAALARRVAHQLMAVKAACLSGGMCADEPEAQQQLMDEVLELLCPLLTPHLQRLQPARREAPHVAVVRRAREYVLDRADEPPSVGELCRTLGVSRRWLQWSFNEVLGIGPMTYLHRLRLNGARRLLLGATPDTKVQDAVEAFGFWHPSRFSHDYRRLFGELPSQTLQRVQARC